MIRERKMATSELDCNHVRDLNYSQQCDFVQNNEECSGKIHLFQFTIFFQKKGGKEEHETMCHIRVSNFILPFEQKG